MGTIAHLVHGGSCLGLELTMGLMCFSELDIHQKGWEHNDMWKTYHRD